GGRAIGEAVGIVEDVKDGRDHQRAGDDADDEGGLLAPRRGGDELAGLQVLQVVVGDHRDREDHGGDQEGERDDRGIGREAEELQGAEHQQRGDDDGENADARNRAVGRSDQAGHVAAYRRDDEADEDDIDEAADDERRGGAGQRRAVSEAPEQDGDGGK